MIKLAFHSLVLAALGLLAATAAFGMDIGTGIPTPLSATVLLLGSFDWQRYESQTQPPYTSRCVDMVWRAATLGSPAIQFVPTMYWRSGGPTGDVQSYCWLNAKDDCRPFDQASIASFQEGMRMCFEAAISAGFTTIHITPHLDSGDGGDWTLRTWRNGLIFDPTQRYGGYSYEEILLEPLAQTVAPFLAPKGPVTKLYFALQGEMGATVMRYPNAYMAIMPRLRAILTTSPSAAIITTAPVKSAITNPLPTSDRPQGVSSGNSFLSTITRWFIGGDRTPRVAAADSSRPTTDAVPNTNSSNSSNSIQQQQAALPMDVITSTGEAGNNTKLGAAVIKFGLTFNFVYSDGAQGASSSSFLWALQTALFGWAIGSRPGFNAPAYRVDEVEALLKQCDFIGVSAYASLNGASFPPQELQNSAFNLMDGFKAVGLDLKGIMVSKGAELHYVEFGVGGGISQSGQFPAMTPDQASLRPYWGVQGQYSTTVDPWRPKDMALFRRNFYNTTLTWLQQGGGPTYGVSSCFVWGKASWDVFGIYPESTTSVGSYGDGVIIDSVTAYNQQITSSGA